MERCQPPALGCPQAEKKEGLPQLLSGRPYLSQPALLANCPGALLSSPRPRQRLVRSADLGSTDAHADAPGN